MYIRVGGDGVEKYTPPLSPQLGKEAAPCISAACVNLEGRGALLTGI